MSTSLTVNSCLSLSPSGSEHVEEESSLPPCTLAIWHSSSPTATPTPQDECDFTVEELSENDMDSSDAQILYPYELEEAGSVVEHDTTCLEMSDEDSDTPISSRCKQRRPDSCFKRLIRSQKTNFTPVSRKRIHSEISNTDTKSGSPGSVDSPCTDLEPPSSRRRIDPSGTASVVVTRTNSRVLGAHDPSAGTLDDPMDLDTQVA